jgi:hypothetical protein
VGDFPQALLRHHRQQLRHITMDPARWVRMVIQCRLIDGDGPAGEGTSAALPQKQIPRLGLCERNIDATPLRTEEDFLPTCGGQVAGTFARLPLRSRTGPTTTAVFRKTGAQIRALRLARPPVAPHLSKAADHRHGNAGYGSQVTSDDLNALVVRQPPPVLKADLDKVSRKWTTRPNEESPSEDRLSLPRRCRVQLMP